jgi:hypothetical protein
LTPMKRKKQECRGFRVSDFVNEIPRRKVVPFWYRFGVILVPV